MEFLLAVIIFFSQNASAKENNELIAWNVGQGLWVTLSEPDKCIHFDAGGEYYNANRIRYFCQNKKNFLYLSHWDWDHIGFIKKLQNLVSDLCLEVSPEGPSEEYKEMIVRQLPKCTKSQNEVDQILFPHAVDTLDGEYFDDSKYRHHNHKKKYKNLSASHKNDLSNVFVAQNEFLLPGDSTSRSEKIWARHLKNKKIRVLILAHHGSKTSTSEEFLENVAHATLAIASARKKKYGHPHQIIIDRLKSHAIPILSTEDWGNIHIVENEDTP